MKKGFTLIELVMVIVILGILAATALPRFVDLSNQAKDSAAKAALGNIRAAVAIQYASNAAYGNASFPASVTSSLFADGTVPKEPWSNSGAVEIGTGSAAPSATATTGGWFYNSVTGKVFINDTTGGRSAW